MEENTVSLPAQPKPSTMLWLGAAIAIAATSWTVTLATMAGIGPEAWLLVICGLAASVAATAAAIIAWARYSLARQAATHQRQLVQLAEGQYSLAIAEVRRLQRLVDEQGGRAARERQAISVKLTKVMDMLPDYYAGVADTVEQVTGTDNVRAIARIPRHN